MQRRLTSIAAVSALTLGAAFAAPASHAQSSNYPDRAVRLIVPFAPGGGTDVTARMFAERLGRELGQSIVVENRAGAGSQIGVDSVAKATADGYTLLFGPADGMSVLPALRPTVPYDSIKDFTAVARVATTPFVFTVRNDINVNTFDDLIAAARAKPGAIRYGTPGIGSIAHLAMELLQVETGTKFTHVPYKGGGPAVAGFMANDTEAIISSSRLVHNSVESGKARMLAQTALTPHPDIPKVPTVDSLGIKNYEVVSWFGIFTPAGAPQQVVDRLAKATEAITSDSGFKKQMTDIGASSAYLGPKEFAAFVEQDRNKWTKLAKEADIKVDH